MSTEVHRILIIDDEMSMRHMLRLVLEKEGYEVFEAGNGGEGLATMESQDFSLILCDIRMPVMDGLTFLKKISTVDSIPLVIMMSAYGTMDQAIECMKEGAYDYISKPFKPDEIVLVIKKAEERLRLTRENERLRDRLLKGEGKDLVFKSPVMEQAMTVVSRVADSIQPVLITGETGTGKELVARAIHGSGPRSEGPFVAVNCSAISPSLLESELFGHLKGAFTGADRTREGLFSAADKGTLFLDEVGELSLELQPKLLRVLQEGEVLPVGATKTAKVDVRVLAATAKDLQVEMTRGRFRDDLYYRLAVVDINVPPLRERKEDIPVLIQHFMERIAARDRRTVPEIQDDAMKILMEYDWPGNVRELENLIEKTMIFCREKVIDLGALPWETRRQKRGREEYSLKQAVSRLEQEYIKKALAATEGNRTQAARLLEISLRSLLYKIKEYGID